MATDAADLQGLNGATYLDTTKINFNGRSRGMLIVNDAVLADATCSECVNLGAIIGPTLNAGTFLPGMFTAVTLTSGIVCLPNAQSGNTAV